MAAVQAAFGGVKSAVSGIGTYIAFAVVAALVAAALVYHIDAVRDAKETARQEERELNRKAADKAKGLMRAMYEQRARSLQIEMEKQRETHVVEVTEMLKNTIALEHELDSIASASEEAWTKEVVRGIKR